MNGLDDDALQAFKIAEKRRMTEAASEATVLDRAGIMALMPHRDPMLLLDRVSHRESDLIVAHYDLAHAAAVLAGHYPTRPMFPGVLQVEAIGQAGILLGLLGQGETVPSISLTHVRGARFLSPVVPGAEMEIVARIFDDGLFLTVVGQCLQRGVLCSAAALSGLIDEGGAQAPA